MTQSLLVDIFVFLMGTIFGSFFNVCIYRMPLEKSVMWPGSHCMKCKKPVKWHDNIPVLSYFILRGKCRNCRAKFSMRYAFVELVTGIAFFLIWRHFGFGPHLFIALFLFSGLWVASIIDLDHQIIPDEISLGGLVIGLIVSLIFPMLHEEHIWWRGGVRALLGALMGGGLIYLTGVLGALAFKKEAMGGGDVKLMAMLGAFLGWQQIILIYLLAPVIALPMALFFKFARRMEVIPFGPFLSLSGWIAFLWGHSIISWYFHGMIF